MLHLAQKVKRKQQYLSIKSCANFRSILFKFLPWTLLFSLRTFLVGHKISLAIASQIMRLNESIRRQYVFGDNVLHSTLYFHSYQTTPGIDILKQLLSSFDGCNYKTKKTVTHEITNGAHIKLCKGTELMHIIMRVCSKLLLGTFWRFPIFLPSPVQTTKITHQVWTCMRNYTMRHWIWNSLM